MTLPVPQPHPQSLRLLPLGLWVGKSLDWLVPQLIAMVTCRALPAGAKNCKQEFYSPKHRLPTFPHQDRALYLIPSSYPVASSWYVVGRRGKKGDGWLDCQHHRFREEAGRWEQPEGDREGETNPRNRKGKPRAFWKWPLWSSGSSNRSAPTVFPQWT